MVEFKKVFRGYNISQVNEKIATLEKELATSNDKIKRLEDAASNLTAEKSILEKSVKDLEEKIENYLEEKSILLDKAENANLSKEAINKIYLLAYESGKQLASSPKQHIESLLKSITLILDKGEGNLNGLNTELLSSTDKMKDYAEEIISYNQSIINKIDLFNKFFDEIKGAYASIDTIAAQTNNDIEHILDTYSIQTKEFNISSDKALEPVLEESTIVLDEETTLEQIESDTEIPSSDPAGEEQKEEFSAKEISEEFLDDEESKEEDFDTQSDFTEQEESNEDNAVSQENDTNRGHDIMNLLNKYQKK